MAKQVELIENFMLEGTYNNELQDYGRKTDL